MDAKTSNASIQNDPFPQAPIAALYVMALLSTCASCVWPSKSTARAHRPPFSQALTAAL